MNRLFLHGVNMLNNIMQEEPVAPIWRAEDLTSNAAMLGRFVDELMHGYVEVEPVWAEHMVHRPPINPSQQAEWSGTSVRTVACGSHKQDRRTQSVGNL